jgi:hypothetical protein
MRKCYLFSVIRCMAVLVLLWTCGGVTAQSSADQSFKNIPQTTKANAETKAVTKSNTVANNAMDKVDSASNKAFKSFTGLFKKKNKTKKTDSAATHPPPDTTQGPKASSLIYLPSSIRPALELYDQETAFFITRNQRKNYLL